MHQQDQFIQHRAVSDGLRDKVGLTIPGPLVFMAIFFPYFIKLSLLARNLIKPCHLQNKGYGKPSVKTIHSNNNRIKIKNVTYVSGYLKISALRGFIQHRAVSEGLMGHLSRATNTRSFSCDSNLLPKIKFR
jgi:hypothetical protein